MMCSKGKIMAANRHGINSSDIGPLAKSSFEETTDQFKTAGVFGLIDNIDGVSSNIMVGQIPNCGTGNTEIILDEELIKNTKPRELVEDVREKSQDSINDLLNQDELLTNDLFNIDNIDSDNINI